MDAGPGDDGEEEAEDAEGQEEPSADRQVVQQLAQVGVVSRGVDLLLVDRPIGDVGGDLRRTYAGSRMNPEYDRPDSGLQPA
ncbi:hypothetical protein [Nocardioides endophyticus]|uniref:hypothetical protein n=1 Tax=Nocardioides endophyticus TaxID=1353775 RepID=UPI0031E96B04